MDNSVRAGSVKEFLKNNNTNLIALGVFLIATLQLSYNSDLMSLSLAMLSAGISFFILIDVIELEKLEKKVGAERAALEAFFLVFCLAFPVWVVREIVSKFQYPFVPLIFWLALILVGPVKILVKTIQYQSAKKARKRLKKR